jgi:CRP/FNR family cyclic AMP-dependent transcriptional regulator
MMNHHAIPTVPLFADTRRRDHKELARLADTIDVEAHRMLARQGDVAREFFVILDGVAIASRDGCSIATLGPGDYFGEIGLLDGVRRTASVTAATPLELLVIGPREFFSLLDGFPTVRERIEWSAGVRVGRTARLAT